MKTTLLLVTAILASCAPSPTWCRYNPLDHPWADKDAAALHADNMKAITSNPGYMLP